MMITTPWVEYTEGGDTYRIRATYGLDYDFAKQNNQAPSFSATASIVERRGRGWVDAGGGAAHEAIARHFPELGPYLKWHLVPLTDEPIDYMANAKYWWEKAQREAFGKEEIQSPDPAEAFKHAVLLGTLPGDEMPLMDTPWEEIEPWLESRRQPLTERYVQDMQELGVFGEGPGVPSRRAMQRARAGALAEGVTGDLPSPADAVIADLGIKAAVDYAPRNPYWSARTEEDRRRHDEANHYKVVLKRGTKRMTTYFSMGTALTEEPTAATVLEDLARDAAMYENEGSMESWAASLGYEMDDPDQRESAETDWRRQRESAEKLRAFLGDEAYQELIGAY